MLVAPSPLNNNQQTWSSLSTNPKDPINRMVEKEQIRASWEFWIMVPFTILFWGLNYIFFGTVAERFVNQLKTKYGDFPAANFLRLLLTIGAILMSGPFIAAATRNLGNTLQEQVQAIRLAKNISYAIVELFKIPVTSAAGLAATLGHIEQMLDALRWQLILSTVPNWISNTWGVVGISTFSKKVVFPATKKTAEVLIKKIRFRSNYTPILDNAALIERSSVQQLDMLIHLIENMSIKNIADFARSALSETEVSILHTLLDRMLTAEQAIHNTPTTATERMRQLHGAYLNIIQNLTDEEIKQVFTIIKKLPKPAYILEEKWHIIKMLIIVIMCLPTYIGLAWSAVTTYPSIGWFTALTYLGKSVAFADTLCKERMIRGGWKNFVKNPSMSPQLMMAPLSYKVVSYIILTLFALDAFISWVSPAQSTLEKTDNLGVTIFTLLSTTLINLVAVLPFIAHLLTNGGIAFKQPQMLQATVAEISIKKILLFLQTLKTEWDNVQQDTAKSHTIHMQLKDIFTEQDKLVPSKSSPSLSFV